MVKFLDSVVTLSKKHIENITIYKISKCTCNFCGLTTASFLKKLILVLLFVFVSFKSIVIYRYESSHEKTNIMACALSKDSDQPEHPPMPVWSESSLSAWRKLVSLATHWAHSEDSDKTARMPRLIWVLAWRICHSLVLSWGGSYIFELLLSLLFDRPLLKETKSGQENCMKQHCS